MWVPHAWYEVEVTEAHRGDAAGWASEMKTRVNVGRVLRARAFTPVP